MVSLDFVIGDERLDKTTNQWFSSCRRSFSQFSEDSRTRYPPELDMGFGLSSPDSFSRLPVSVSPSPSSLPYRSGVTQCETSRLLPQFVGPFPRDSKSCSNSRPRMGEVRVTVTEPSRGVLESASVNVQRMDRGTEVIVDEFG